MAGLTHFGGLVTSSKQVHPFTPYTSNVHTDSYYFWNENNPVPANTEIHVTNIVDNSDGSITADFYYDFGKKLKK